MRILHDTHNPKAAKLHEALGKRLAVDDRDDGVLLVLGGDGFMLRAIRENYRPERAFLGLNCGSIGFLLNNVPDDLSGLAETLRNKRFSIRKFPRIAMEALDCDGKGHEATALNDIYVERMTGQTCHLRLEIDGFTVVERLVCDGVVMSTALGSTAYNFSASGPVCSPSLRTMCVTPICPHSPRLSSVVLPLDSTVFLEVLSPTRRTVEAVADGVAVPNIASMTVTPADQDVQLAFLEGHDYTAEMIHKVLTV
jgi:NAD+ kinase